MQRCGIEARFSVRIVPGSGLHRSDPA
jgi:hypothetical protein